MDKGEDKGSVFWVEESNEKTPISVKHKRKTKTKKVEFVGWGSKSLIEFLQSIGKDTGNQLSQLEVTAIINGYVHALNLIHPTKKKRVVCDERLQVLFGKKTVPRNKLHELLHSHFVENHDSSEDDDMYSSEEYDDVNTTCKKQRVSSSEKKTPYQKKKEPEVPLSIYASIIPENLKLLYLKRSLVEELLKKPESFEGKLLGSYIRIKSDPNDYSQKNSHQLHPVTGVKNVPGVGDVCEEVLLQVPNMMKDICIRMLSDDEFSKEECEDLCQRVKDGLLKRPTVVEFEQKAQLLHEDIIKHWLPRELAHLQNLIDRANEKGWRKELFEYLERKKLLQSASEQSKLLTEVPKVTADILEPGATPNEDAQDIIELNNSPISNNPQTDQALPSQAPDDAAAAEQPPTFVGVIQGNKEAMENKGNGVIPSINSGEHIISFQWVETKNTPNTRSSSQALDLNNTSTVIELSDDEETPPTHEQNEDKIQQWFYLDPQNQIQGPVSKANLKRWNDAGYFKPDFIVWKDGQTRENAILLTDMLSGSFSKL